MFPGFASSSAGSASAVAFSAVLSSLTSCGPGPLWLGAKLSCGTLDAVSEDENIARQSFDTAVQIGAKIASDRYQSKSHSDGCGFERGGRNCPNLVPLFFQSSFLDSVMLLTTFFFPTLYTLRDKLTSWLRLKVTRYVMTAVKTMATFRPFQLNVSVVDQSDCRYVRSNDEQFG